MSRQWVLDTLLASFALLVRCDRSSLTVEPHPFPKEGAKLVRLSIWRGTREYHRERIILPEEPDTAAGEFIAEQLVRLEQELGS